MSPLTPEAEARQKIDQQLKAAGWSVQSLSELNLFASRGVAVREVQSQGGPADYMLFVDGKALGIVEAKKVGSTLSHVAEQSARYGNQETFHESSTASLDSLQTLFRILRGRRLCAIWLIALRIYDPIPSWLTN